MISTLRNSAVGYRRRGASPNGPIQLTIVYVAAQFDFKWKAPSTSTLKIYQGDGSFVEVAGQDATLVTTTTTYSDADTYTFWVEGDWLDLTWLQFTGVTVTGDVSGFSALTNLTLLYCYSSGVSGDVSGWSALTNLTSLRCETCSLSGDVSGWSALTSLSTLYCRSNLGLSGDISGWHTMIIATIQCYSTIVGWSTQAAWSHDSESFTFISNGWTSTEVDDCLISLAAGPVTNSTINIAGTNAVRTAASDAAKAIILANGNALTVNE